MDDYNNVDWTDGKVNIEEITAKFRQLNDVAGSVNSTMASMGDTLSSVIERLEGTSSTPVIDSGSVELAAALDEVLGSVSQQLGISVGAAKKLAKEVSKSATNEKDAVKLIKGKAVEYKRLVKELEKGLKVNTIGSKVTKGTASAFKSWGRDTAQFGTKLTGVHLSLGSILALILQIHNETRKIYGLSMRAAGRLGGSPAQIKKVQQAMYDLRKHYMLSYEEAGKITEELTNLGFKADELADKRIPFLMPKNNKAMRAMIEEMPKLAEESANKTSTVFNAALHLTLDQEIADNAKDAFLKTIEVSKRYKDTQKRYTAEVGAAQKAHISKTIGLSTELVAIQEKYGIAVGQSGGVIKGLVQDFNQTTGSARGMYGTVIKTTEHLQKMGVQIDVKELITDWTALADKTKAYQTDLMGVLAMYNTLIRKDIADKIGLGKAPMSVRKDLAKAITSMPLELDFAWKAKLGEDLGKTVAERGIKFEQLVTDKPMEGLRRVASFLDRYAKKTGDIYQAEFRGREILQRMMPSLSKEAVMHLARASARGKFTEGSVVEMTKGYLAEAAKVRESDEAWKKGRADLIRYAGTSNRAVQKIEELVQNFIRDFFRKYVTPLFKFLAKIATYITAIYEGIQNLPFFKETGPEQKLKENLAKMGIDIKSETLEESAGKRGTVLNDIIAKASRRWYESERGKTRYAGYQLTASMGGPGSAMAQSKAHQSMQTEAEKTSVIPALEVLSERISRAVKKAPSQQAADKLIAMLESNNEKIFNQGINLAMKYASSSGRVKQARQPNVVKDPVKQ